VDAYIKPTGQGEATWVASQRKWTQGWRRLVLPGIFAVYLIFVGQAVAQNEHGPVAVVGFVVLAGFLACYFLAVARGRQWGRRRPWILNGVMFALFLAELPFAHAAAFVMCLYITALIVGLLGAGAAPIVLLLALAALLVPAAIPAWHDTIASDFDDVTPIAIPVVALVTFAVLQVVEGNRALAEARAELARLTAENERSRIARDLHDLLGHSLTTITVKAGLARRLGGSNPERAFEEVAQVEALARRSLADVRAAVADYREVTLAGELATGREVLRAAGISAEVPRAIDVVDPAHQELFGWVVREGLTNVVRHARASTCTILLSACSIEIVDDGVGGAALPGNGLSGLRERVAAAGGVVDAGPIEPRGWRLQASLERVGSGR
jgi:two-component system, NarL family, sensor histidine kinase DesK